MATETAVGVEARVEGEGAERVLVVRVPLNPVPVASKTGKTRVVASTHGNVRTELQIEGKPVTVGLNAYIK